MRGYRGPETEEDFDVEELDGDIHDKFLDSFPLNATCYGCYSRVRIENSSPVYQVEDGRYGYIDCPKCGYSVLVSIRTLAAHEIGLILPSRSLFAHDFIWPIRNWWRRRTRFYQRRCTMSATPIGGSI